MTTPAADDIGGLTIAVIGLGLIGGSLARDLARRGARVMGEDASSATLAAATAERVVEPLRVEAADIVVIAVPVDAAVRVLHELAPRLGRARLITDTGSTKGTIVAAAEALGLGERFVGAHPLAGDHRSGFAASRAGLFDGARVYLTPAGGAAAAAQRLAAELWTAVGGAPLTMAADAHDALLAWSSHLPQVAASALALALQEAGVPRTALGSGGRDMTRLAASDAAMWTAIGLDNARHLHDAVYGLEQRLAAFRAAIEREDAEALHTLFRDAAAWSATDAAATPISATGAG